MASSTQAIQTQEDFSGGAVPNVAPHLVPFNAVAALRNGFVDEDGSIYRRGGAEGIAPGIEAETITNLITNPSFEVDNAGWTGPGRSTAAFKFGTATGWILESSGGGIQSASVDLDVGDTYTLSVYIRSVTGTKMVTTGIQFRDSGDSVTGATESHTAHYTTSWTREVITFVATDPKVRVYFNLTDEAYIDGIQLIRGAAPVPYFDGSEGGGTWTGTPHASTSTLTPTTAQAVRFLWSGDLGPGRRVLVASSESFGFYRDGSLIAVGDNGLTYPRPVGESGRYLFIGKGYIYAGSQMTAPYTTGTVSFTQGDTTVTGSGTTWNTLTDAGMLFQHGDERVYRVASITDTTHLELAEPYEGATDSGEAYTLTPLYQITDDDPYPRADIYTVAQNRLVWAEGNLLRFAPLVDGFPANHKVHTATDEWELPEPIVGLAEIDAALLVFTTAGTFVLQGIGYEIVDFAGNPQQRLTKLSEHVLIEGCGIAYWDRAVIAPTTDGVYLFDGITAPVKLSQNIENDYQTQIRRGYRAGQAAVYNSHYFLPFINNSAEPKKLYSVQLDRQAFDRRRRITHPWSWHDGDGAEVAALSADLSDDRAPRLLAAQANNNGGLLDCTAYFTPDSDHALDPDGTAFDLDVITRDFATGNGTDNSVKKLRSRYELSGDGEVQFSYSDGQQDAGGAKWNQVTWNNFQWASSGTAFTSLACNGSASDGRDTHPCRVGKRTRFIRFRLRTNGSISVFRLRSLELFIKPSRATRR